MRFSFASRLLLACAGSGGFLFAQPATFQYRTVSDWGTGFSGEITIRNGSTERISGWGLQFEFDRSIDSIWDARISAREGSKYVVRSAGWNDVIDAGKSLTFGFQGTPGGVSRPPAAFQLSSAATIGPEAPKPASGAILVALRETGRWADGYSASISVTNDTGAELRDWTLSFTLDSAASSFWNATFRREGNRYFVTPSQAAALAPGAAALLGFSAAGKLTSASAAQCRINSADCVLTTTLFAGPAGPAQPIQIDGEPAQNPYSVLTLPGGLTPFRLRSAAGSTSFRAASSNPAVASVQVSGDALRITAVAAGRASIRIDDIAAGTSRWVGVRVPNADGTPPGLPPYVAIGSVSEDTTEHLGFWRSIEPGARNKRADLRYIYLNGGPSNGWDTWSNEPGGRAVHYIRNSRTLGMIPFFVFYNIPDGGESYETDLAHVQSQPYMVAYFRNLKLFLDIARRESPDDMVGLILEPDFLGYMAQNSGRAAADIPAVTRAAYLSGVLGDGDPRFADNVQGLVRAINYTISKYAPQVRFGWQMNLWASPGGGYTTSIPGRGIIRKTDEVGIEAGRQAVYDEAVAITNYYLDAGVASHGAGFVSIDKYGLDAGGAEPGAARDPSNSIWFWNADHWNNYLLFARAMKDASGLPVVLWQLPVGRINSTAESNPYAGSGGFEDLPNTHRKFEDSAASFFLGDTFRAADARFEWFSANATGDPGVQAGNGSVTWAPHMNEAAAAGVVAILFGPGVGASTGNVGEPPTDGYWWISKVQRYLAAPAPLPLP